MSPSAHNLTHPPTLFPAPRAISNAFLYLQRRKRSGFLCAVSPVSHESMTKVYGRDQIHYLMQHTEYLLAPGGAKSTSTDSKLLEVGFSALAGLNQ
jgi:hypothetical protein